MQKSRIINWARSSNESEKKKTQRAMEMSVLSSPSQQDPSPSDPPSKESFPLKRQKPILKTSDSSSSWDTPEAKLVQFRVTGSESDADVEGQAVQNVNLDIAPPTENNTQTVGTRYGKSTRLLANSCHNSSLI